MADYTLSAKITGDSSGIDQEFEKAIKITSKFGDEAQNAGDKAASSKGGITTLKLVVADLASQGIQVAINALKEFANELRETISDYTTGSAQLQASTGLTTSEMEKYRSVMGDIYADNFGESFNDVANALGKVKQQTKEVDPSKLKELTENAIAMEDVFESDFNETIRGVNQMMKQFGIDSTKAFDLFAKGSQEGLDYTNELGDNVAEYAGKFAQAGYSAEEYFQLLKNGAEGGAYNLDKVNDAINEVTNKLADGSIADSLGIYSSKTQELFHAWQNGGATQKDVIDSIVSDITNCTNEQERLTMAATAFGTMGEDANAKFVTSLTTVGDTFSDVQGTMENVKNIKYDNLASAWESFGRTIQVEILERFVTGKSVITNFVSEATAKIPQIADKVEAVGQTMQNAFSAASNAVASIIAPIQQNIETAFGNIKQTVQNSISSAFDTISPVIDTVYQNILKFSADMPSKINVAFSTVSTAISESFDKISPKLETLKTKAESVFSSIRNTVLSSIVPSSETIQDFRVKAETAFTDVSSKFITTFQPIIAAVSPAISVLKESVVDAFQKIKDAMSGKGVAGSNIFITIGSAILGLNPVVKLLLQALMQIGPQIQATFGQLITIVAPIISQIILMFAQLIQQTVPILITAFQTITPIITQVISTIATVIANLLPVIIPVIQAIVTAAGALIPVIMNVVSALIPVISQIVQTVVPVIGLIVEMIGQMIAQLSPFIALLISQLVPVITTIASVIANVVTAVLPTVISIINVIISVIKTLMPVITSIIDIVIQVATNIISTVLSIASTIISALTPIIAFIGGMISTIISVISPIISFVANIIASVIAAIQPIVTTVAGIITQLVSTSSSIFRGILTVVTTIFSGVSSVISGAINVASGVISTISGVVSNVFDAVYSTVSGIMDKVSSVISSVFHGIESAWNGLTTFVSGVFDGIGNAVENLVGQVKDFVNGVIGGINAAIGLINMIPGVQIGTIPYLAHGTDNWQGGFAYMNEGGRGELTYLPNGAQVIPHDISTTYAKEAARASTKTEMVDMTGILDGVIIQVFNNNSIDGTQLKEVVSDYTIRKIGNRQRAITRSKGRI